jgi:predicted ArsR family transcriptional regulator
MDRVTFDEQVSGIAALEHPTSRQVYRLVLEQDWVSRDSAADALEVARSVAAFHLDKLVDAGLLTARFERVSGRTGPGAGRPAKLYGRSGHEIGLSLPARQYDLAGSMLADAVTRAGAGAVPVGDAVSEAARETGARIGAASRPSRRSGHDSDHGSDRSSAHGSDHSGELLDVLAGQGYEPRPLGRTIAMVNCPFHALAEQHRDLVCHMNLDFLSGVLEGIGATESFSVRLAPEAGYCCVRIDER